MGGGMVCAGHLGNEVNSGKMFSEESEGGPTVWKGLLYWICDHLGKSKDPQSDLRWKLQETLSSMGRMDEVTDAKTMALTLKI